MTWIRGPLWDSCWILSGLPIGLALVACDVKPSVVLAIYLVLNSAHLFAPISMAWTYRGFRRVMLAQKVKYILVPAVILIVGGVSGATVGKNFPINPLTLAVKVDEWPDYLRPLIMMLPVYFVWNAFHFGMQNYGFLRLYWKDADRSKLMQLAMFWTLFGMLIIPMFMRQPLVFLFCFGLVIINHQLASIGLSSQVWAIHHGRSPLWFAGALLLVGSGLAWGIFYAPDKALMTVVGLRLAAGIVHFLYDRWVWKFSGLRVREPIGAELLGRVA